MHNKKRLAKTAIALLTSILFIQAVPAHADSVHVAKEGDTFFTLSKQYGVDMNTLIKTNKDISPYNIYGGLKITIPGNENKVEAAPVQAKSQEKTVTAASLDVNTDNKVVQAWGKHSTIAKRLVLKQQRIPQMLPRMVDGAPLIILATRSNSAQSQWIPRLSLLEPRY